MQKKKIAIFINSLARAGAEKIVAFLINNLADEYEIHLLLLDSTTIEFSLPSNLKIIQIGKKKNSKAGFFEILQLPLYAIRVKKYLVQHNIPLLFSFLSRPNFISGFVKKLRWKGKLIISERTMTSSYYTTATIHGRLGRFLVSSLYKEADLIITNTELNAKDLKATFDLKNKIQCIYNPVNLDVAHEAKLNAEIKKEYNKDEFVFCNIGRYDVYKNQELLIKAFALLKNYNCKLLIIGKDVPENLNSFCIKHNLQNRVILMGLQQNVFPLLHTANAFVLSSTLEGFPNVLIEALACSLPVISTDCKSGPREILAPNTLSPQNFTSFEKAAFGILVNVNDENMLAEAMKNMMDNEELYASYKQKSLQRAADFEDKVIMEQFSRVLNLFY